METDLLEILQTAALILGIIMVIMTPVFVWLRGKFKCIDKVNKRTFRQSKALIILANRLDDIIEDQHGKDHHLGDEVEEILKDDRGNL